MSDAERERLVERYVAFEMSADEEQEFILRAATDAALFTMLRSYRLMDRALAQNRDRLAGPPASVGERAMSVLASTPASSTASRPRGRAWSRMVSVLGALLLLTGGYLLRGMISTDGRGATTPNALPADASTATDRGGTIRRESTEPTPDRSTVEAIPGRHATNDPVSPPRARGDREPASEIRARATVASRHPAPAESAPDAASADTVASSAAAVEQPSRVPVAPPAADSITFRARIILPEGRR